MGRERSPDGWKPAAESAWPVEAVSPTVEPSIHEFGSASKPSEPPIHLPAFEGPLDLLLHLIRQQRIDIADIPIALVARQYVAYLRLMETRDMELDIDIDRAGEFLVMAATLMEIKSRMLLPKPPPEEGEEEDDPRQELVDRLIEYQRYRDAAEVLREMEEERRRSFPRGGAVEYDPGPSVRIEPESAAVSLLLALRALLEETDDREEEPPAVRRDAMSLRLKLREIRATLATCPTGIRFESLFRHGGGRDEMIVTFLALLELLRNGRIRVRQAHPLGEILVSNVREGGEEGSERSDPGEGDAGE